MAGVSMNPEKPDTTNGYWMPTAVFAQETGVTRERLLQLFQEENIDGRVFFHPLSSLPMFQLNLSNRNSYDLSARAINLPSYHALPENTKSMVAIFRQPHMDFMIRDLFKLIVSVAKTMSPGC